MAAKKKTRFAGVLLLTNKDRSYQVRATYQCPITKKQWERVRIIKNVSLVDAEQTRIELYKELKERVAGSALCPSIMSHKTLDEFSLWYFDYIEENDIKNSSTLSRYKSSYSNMVSQYLGSIKLVNLTQSHIRAYCDKIQNKRNKGVDLYSSSTFMYAFRMIRAMLSVAEREGYIDRNPAKGVRVKFKYGKLPRKKDTLTMDEVKGLLEAGRDNLEFCVYLSIASSVGLRIGEAIALTWADIDLDNSTISITKTHDRGKLKETTKNSSDNIVPLTDLAREYVLKWKELQFGKLNPNNLVFLSRYKKSYRNNLWFNRQLKTYCLKAGIDKHITSHCLRYTANTLLFLADVNPAIIQKILNHKSGDIMSQHYLEMDTATKRAVVNDLWK
jgi:integrase